MANIYRQLPITESRHNIYMDDNDPDTVLHIVKLGFDDTYVYFYEDAHETEPAHSGIKVADSADILKAFNIELPKA